MKGISRLFTAALLSCAAVTVHAQTELQTYVQRCQTELQFAASDVKPMNCNDGPQFAQGSKSPVNDFVVYKPVNQNVDMVAACRWGDGTAAEANNTKFLSIELLIHNRVNGGTCFFAAKDIGSAPTKPVSTAIVPVTNFSTTTRPNANDFWLAPSQMANKVMFTDAGATGAQDKLVCVRCHSQGPYIASARIAPFLANYGLLNDGHHTYSNFAALGHYYVVGSRAHTVSDPGSFALGNWNFLIAQSNRSGGCSSSCHALAKTEAAGSFSPMGNLTAPNDPSAVVLPSIADDVRYLNGNGMSPDAEDSPYRWINIDQPGDGVEAETFTAAKPKIAVTGYCGAPTMLEANAVGTDAPFSNLAIGFMPNKLRAFNLRDGLQCLNADQPAGQKCGDYQVSYKCPTAFAKWVGPFNKDTNYSDDGDHEERSRAWGDARAACGGKDPIAMRADALLSGTIIHSATAPADRLAQLNSSGLVCRNADQGSGQTCSNYAVRYRNCREFSDAQLARIKNAWTNPPTFGDRYLTTSNNVDGADTRAQANNYQYPSQDWTIEHMSNGNVRLNDIWSGKYLTATNNNDLAAVVVKNSDGLLTRQQWIMESVAGSTEVRFRNVGSGKYLTVGNYTSDPYFAPIVSQTLSAQNWASQRWLVQ
jgi:hypothetical protein